VKADEKINQPEYPESPMRKKKRTLGQLELKDISKTQGTTEAPGANAS